MKELLIINFLIPLYVAAQSYTIGGFKGDTIYAGVENEIRFSNLDCNNLKHVIKPEIFSSFENCTISLIPGTPNQEYHLSVYNGSAELFKIILYSKRITLDIKCLANTLLPIQTETISVDIAKQLRGMRSIVNCPWLRDSCIIHGYEFRIEINGEVIYVEEIEGWQLSTEAKNILQKITKGSTIIFENVRWKCPGDDANGQKDIKLEIN